MKNTSLSRSISHRQGGFFNLRALLGLTLCFLGLALGIFAAKQTLSQRESELPRYMPVPGENPRGEAAGLEQLEQYWRDRLTFPTGRFDPAWLRAAAAQHARMTTGVPTGKHLKLKLHNPHALSTTNFTALGPQPEWMTGCSGCFDYTTTEGRVNSIAVDPTTTVNGSIVAYLGSVGGGVWKTTNCCSASTTWTSTTNDPLLATRSEERRVGKEGSDWSSDVCSSDLIVAYLGSVGGGVWKTTNCCSASTTWTSTTNDPLLATRSEERRVGKEGSDWSSDVCSSDLIVAYLGSVGGGVWKTTNCCSASTTWTSTTNDPLLATRSEERRVGKEGSDWSSDVCSSDLIVAYLGSVGGGVWKTTNCCSASTTWTSTTNDPLLATISIDSVTLDPSNHNTIYAGTGDLNFGSFSMGSQGILKSTDAGAHWTLLGANVFGPALPEPAGQFPQYNAVGKVRVDPNNSNKVVAGTKTGLYLSYDGGANWTGPCVPDSFNTQRHDITGLELTNMG